MKEVLINVDGMVCNGCENRIQNAIQNIEGVNKVKANYKKGIVKIKLDGEININEIKEKIEDIGFKVKE